MRQYEPRRPSTPALLSILPLALASAGCTGGEAGGGEIEVAQSAQQALEAGTDYRALHRDGRYAYAPSIMKEGGRFHLYACGNDGENHGDSISYVSSDDGVTWDDPTTVLFLPVSLSPNPPNDETPTLKVEHTCDPSIVRFQAPGDPQPYYYLYYSTAEIGTDSARGTVNAVARSESPAGPFRHYVGPVTDGPTEPSNWVLSNELSLDRKPTFLQVPDAPCGRTPGCYGAGQPTVVARDGVLHMWYFDKTGAEPGIYLTTSTNGVKWLDRQRAILDVRDADDQPIGLNVESVDVKYDEGTDQYVMVDVVAEHEPSSSLVVRTSSDGLTWSRYGVDTTLPGFASNGGLSGDERGHMHGGTTLVGFGAPFTAPAAGAPGSAEGPRSCSRNGECSHIVRSCDEVAHVCVDNPPNAPPVPVPGTSCDTDVDCDGHPSAAACDAGAGVCRDVWGIWDLLVRPLDLTRVCKEVGRVAGPSRFDTSLSLARALYPKAETVILVNGEHNDTPDALAAGPLASRLGAPIVTVPRKALPQATHDYLASSGLKRALIVGGTGAIEPAVEAQVVATGLAVERIAGADRYETAAKIADRIEALKKSEGEASENIAFVASGETLVDALATGPVASLLRAPIVLVREKSVPEATKQVLEARNLHRLYLVGGEKAVSEAVRMELDIDENDRISGPSRYETAVELAEFAREWGMSADTVWIARADRTADAVAVGGFGRLVLLSDTAQLTGPTRDFLSVRSNRAELLGGYGALSALTEEQTCIALGAIPSEAAPFGTAGGTSTFAKSAPEVEDEGGCAVSPGSPGRPALLAALGLALAALVRRRRG